MVPAGALPAEDGLIREVERADTGGGMNCPARISFTAFAVGFFLSFRTILAMISARWLGWGSEPGVIAALGIELALLTLVVFQAMGAAVRPSGWIVRQPSVRWVLLFLAFSCTSLVWSATVSRPASFLYWCGMAADVALIVLLLRGGVVSEISHSVMQGFVCSTCVLACVAWIMPATDDLRLGNPDYFNTNQIGNLCAMAIFMGQFLGPRNQGKHKPMIWLLAATLLRSLSKATIIAFAVAEVFLLIYDKSIGRGKKVAIACIAVLVVAAYWGLIGSYFDVYTTSGNQAETLTGRTTIWAYTLSTAIEKPWIGNGMDAMWKVFPPFGKEMFEARHAENELLQQFFAYGAVGVLMLAGLYGSLWRSIIRLQDRYSKAVLLAVMLFVVIRGLVEAEPFDLLLPLWMITLMSCIVKDAQEPGEYAEYARDSIPAGLNGKVIAGSSAL